MELPDADLKISAPGKWQHFQNDFFYRLVSSKRGSTVNIRESNEGDIDSIYKLHKNAFGEPEGPVVAKLACDILNTDTKEHIYSFVVERKENVIGHIIFSPVNIEGVEKVSAYILAPLAISKNYQKQGLGAQLIKHGLNKLKADGTGVVFVLGDPNYYGRSGFQAGSKVLAPYELEYPEAWMSKELKEGVLSNVHGVAVCVPALMSREHW